jgi:hypothetical protein
VPVPPELVIGGWGGAAAVGGSVHVIVDVFGYFE